MKKNLEFILKIDPDTITKFTQQLLDQISELLTENKMLKDKITHLEGLLKHVE